MHFIIQVMGSSICPIEPIAAKLQALAVILSIYASS